MKKIALLCCMLVAAVSAQAQFEKGKWIVNPSLSGLQLTHNTGADKTAFGLQAQGGTFVVDNLAVLVNLGVQWNATMNREIPTEMDVYTAGAGLRYYFSRVGVYLGANFNVDRYDFGGDKDETKCAFGLEAGYAFFLSRNVTIEPAAYWKVNDDWSTFGLKVGFGIYF